MFSFTFILSGGSPWPVVEHTKTTSDSEIKLACLMRANTYESSTSMQFMYFSLKKKPQMGRWVKAVIQHYSELKLSDPQSGINVKSHIYAYHPTVHKSHSPRCNYSEVTLEQAVAFSVPAAQSSGLCPGQNQSGSHTKRAGWALTLWPSDMWWLL